MLIACAVLTSVFCANALAADAPPAAPVNTAPPTLSVFQKPDLAMPAIGDTLICNPGTWTGADRFTYRWYRGLDELFTNESYYKVVAKDALDVITCEVTAIHDGARASARVSTPQKVSPPKVAVFQQLLRGTGEDARIMRACGNTMARACKVHLGDALYSTGALTPRIDDVPLTVGIERRVPLAGGGFRWAIKRGVVGKSDKGTFKLSIKRAMSVQGLGDFRIRTRITPSEKALPASSKYLYIKVLPALPR
jgi:hypothetical protein